VIALEDKGTYSIPEEVDALEYLRHELAYEEYRAETLSETVSHLTKLLCMAMEAISGAERVTSLEECAELVNLCGRGRKAIAALEELQPARAIPPGRLLDRELMARRWSRSYLANRVGVAELDIDDIISGAQRITPELSEALGKALVMSPTFWSNLEENYQTAVRAGNPDGEGGGWNPVKPEEKRGIADHLLAWIVGGRKGPYIEPLDSIERRMMWRQDHGETQLLVDILTLFGRLRKLEGKSDDGQDSL
jgi:plasmid maintenance system antidote protein VapI